MYEIKVELTILARAIIPFAGACVFSGVFVYLTLVRQRMGKAYPYISTFIITFILFLCGPLINVMPNEEIKAIYDLIRNLLLFSTGIPALLIGLFILANSRISKKIAILSITSGLAWSALFFLTLPFNLGLDYVPTYPTIYYAQALFITLWLLAPCCYLLFKGVSRFVSFFLYGALSLYLFMLIGNLLELWEVYYVGSSLTPLIWGAAMFFDIKQTNRELEHSHQQEKTRPEKVILDKVTFSDYYPAERDLAYPLKEREELIEIVRTSSSGLIEDKATMLFTKLKQFTYDDINTIRLRVKEILFMLYDTVIFTGAEAPALIQKLEGLSRRIDDCTNCDDIFVILTQECQFLVQTVKESSNRSLNNQLVEDIKKYLNTYYYKDISVNDVAATVKVSRSQATQVFKANTQQTINQYLTDIRVNRAKILLLSQPVTNVAFDVGFNNPTYFSTVFKKSTGMTPSQYQQVARQ
ncbi:helix-turn-helix transcriptional regulator [Vibrio sp. WXL210]|uniref:helix-turn-helix transcriptional regulator n=1 Tax=Vibrio sp. WXL210 TaxID=3450709 RepID=UPI003EC7237C